MLSLALSHGRPLDLLCLGAHPDDIEIGAGGTILDLGAAGHLASVTWIVLTGTPDRIVEGRKAAEAFLAGATACVIRFHSFRDGYLPAAFAEVKDEFEALKLAVRPDVVLAPRTDDAHQDHRLVGQLAWNTFRDHLVLEYEIPKYDGDMGSPNVFVPLSAEILENKLDLIGRSFVSQAGRTWFDPDTFRSLARLRGIEAGAGVQYAEAFSARKLRLSSGGWAAGAGVGG